MFLSRRLFHFHRGSRGWVTWLRHVVASLDYHPSRYNNNNTIYIFSWHSDHAGLGIRGGAVGACMLVYSVEARRTVYLTYFQIFGYFYSKMQVINITITPKIRSRASTLYLFPTAINTQYSKQQDQRAVPGAQAQIPYSQETLQYQYHHSIREYVKFACTFSHRTNICRL